MPVFLEKCFTDYGLFFAGCEVTIPAEKVNDYATRGTEKLNCALKELRRLFMVENMLDSIKFGLSLWVLTYIGSWFNAMTLLIMGWVGLFSVPKVRLVLNWYPLGSIYKSHVHDFRLSRSQVEA